MENTKQVKQTSFRLTPKGYSLLVRLAAEMGLSQVGVIENLIRMECQRQNITHAVDDAEWVKKALAARLEGMASESEVQSLISRYQGMIVEGEVQP